MLIRKDVYVYKGHEQSGTWLANDIGDGVADVIIDAVDSCTENQYIDWESFYIARSPGPDPHVCFIIGVKIEDIDPEWLDR